MRKSKEPDISGASGWPFERKCPECGKVFSGTLLEEWVYKDGNNILCSYTCLRRRKKALEAIKAKIAEKTRRAKKLTPAQKEGLVRRYANRGLTNEEISRETGLSGQLVNYYRRKIEEEND